MSGYKRVNFYELCRLCANSQEKEKIHIFQEEGRKLQLQTKIQATLSLKVSETDDLPKVLCSKCLQCLEDYYTFRTECIASETMLSTYFNNFRCTTEFIKSGQVYIKDEPCDKQQVNQVIRNDAINEKTVIEDNKKANILYVNEESVKNDSLLVQVAPEYINLRNLQPNPIDKIKFEKKVLQSNDMTLNNLHTYQELLNGTPSVRPLATNWSELVVHTVNEKKYECDICKKTFKRREHLYQHAKLHTGFRPFTCERCNKSFMRKEHLIRHIVSHSGLKNFTCDVCDKSFSRNDNLLKHKKTHERETNFVCEICNKHFVLKHYYIAHQLSHETDLKNNIGFGVKT